MAAKRRRSRRNPSESAESIRQAMVLEKLSRARGRASSALDNTGDYAALRRELGKESKRATAARHARTGIRAFPLGTMAIVAVVAYAIGYAVAKPSDATTA